MVYSIRFKPDCIFVISLRIHLFSYRSRSNLDSTLFGEELIKLNIGISNLLMLHWAEC